MSWDISIHVEVDGNSVEAVENVNYTHNCNGMIRAAGFAEWPYQLDGMNAYVFARKLGKALSALRSDPGQFRVMDPENGWGSCDTLVPVLTDLHSSASRFPSGKVRCSA